MVPFVPKTDPVYQKLLDTIKLYNKFCPAPITLVEEAFENIRMLKAPMKNSRWTEPMDSHDLTRSISTNIQGNITIKSLCNDVTLTLSQNGISCEVEFPMVLPGKSPEWVADSNMSFDGNIERKMVMMHPHAILKQEFTISDLPDEWKLQLHLLW